MNRTQLRTFIRNFLIELVIYGALVVVYFLVVLRFLGEPLLRLFQENLLVYAPVALALILLQGLALEWVTSFLISKLGLERLE